MLLADKDIFVVGQMERNIVVLGVPHDRARAVRHGKYLQQPAAHKLLYEAVLFSDVSQFFISHTLHGRLAVTVIQNTEIIKRDIAVFRTQQLFHLGAFDFNHRFHSPLLGKEEPSAEDLLRRQSVIIRLAVELGGEILGQSLKRAYPAFIKHVYPTQLVGSLVGESVSRGKDGGRERRHHNKYRDGVAQQTAETRRGREKQQHKTEKHHAVAAIGHGDAPRVVSHAKSGAPFSVEILLIEPVTLMATDIVHRNHSRFSVDGDMAYEVHRSAGAGILYDLEILEADGKRQRECVALGG